jgi:predicted RNase H-like HicB family nuclease
MSKQIIHKEGSFTNVVINVLVGTQGDYYVAYCPALELSSYGKSEDEARKNFETELAVFIEETEKRGTLEKILLKLGWCLRQSPLPTYVPPPHSNLSLQISHPQTFSETVAIPF